MMAEPLSQSEKDEDSSLFSVEELALINSKNKPAHVAIIMDGNRRWASQKGLDPIMGHVEGAETLIRIVQAAAELGIEMLTVYSFSTENWMRPSHEVDSLMQIFELYLKKKKDLMVQKGIRLEAIGDIDRLPSSVQETLLETKQATGKGDRIRLVVALNYGARDEIRRAILKIIHDVEEKKISSAMIDEAFISRYLDTGLWGDPDLLIRTSGELRLSNFLLWQSAYTEFYTTGTLWPDFSPKAFYQAVVAFQNRGRRYGGV